MNEAPVLEQFRTTLTIVIPKELLEDPIALSAYCSAHVPEMLKRAAEHQGE
jgi:hypothetical protein